VTWLKVSPGGKLSNVTRGFSAFTTTPPPSWTVARDDTMHHILRMRFSSAGSILFEVLGIIGNGSPPAIVDTFTYTVGACPRELVFEAGSVSLTAETDDPAGTQEIGLSTIAGAAADYSLTDDAPWLSVDPTSGFTPATLTLTADPTGLAPGTYRGTVTATAPVYEPVHLSVTFTVIPNYDILVSSAPDRSAPQLLDDLSVSGRIYVFIEPETGASRVRFFIDDPTMTSTPIKVENNPPWDLGGTSSTGAALPYDTSTLASGGHSLTVQIDLVAGGAETLIVHFSVAN
jgi:hypothetical protein